MCVQDPAWKSMFLTPSIAFDGETGIDTVYVDDSFAFFKAIFSGTNKRM